jgi:hypothetical protein
MAWRGRGIVRAAAAALIAAAIAIACVHAPAPGRGPARIDLPRDAPRSVILITLDGVRWQEIFSGVDARLAAEARLPRSAVRGARELLPALHRLFFERGTVLGDPRRPGGIAASGPRFVSLPAYVELMTGAISGCHDNGCAPSLERTLADDIGGLPGIRGREEVAVFASWEEIGRVAAAPPGAASAAPAGVLVDAGRGGADPSPAYPGSARYRPDRGTAAAAIAHLIQRRPRFLWVALGDTDEWAHRRDYRGYLEALAFADRFVEEVAMHLAEMGAYGERAVLLVTTDHGRDDGFADHGGPSSQAVWLMARGGGLPRRGAIGTRRQRYLRDVAPTVQALLGAPVRRCEGCGEVIQELL